MDLVFVGPDQLRRWRIIERHLSRSPSDMGWPCPTDPRSFHLRLRLLFYAATLACGKGHRTNKPQLLACFSCRASRQCTLCDDVDRLDSRRLYQQHFGFLCEDANDWAPVRQKGERTDRAIAPQRWVITVAMTMYGPHEKMVASSSEYFYKYMKALHCNCWV